MEATRKSPRKTARKASALETVGMELELEVTEMRKGVKSSKKKKRGRGNSSCDDDDDVKISSLMAAKRKRKPLGDDGADEEENMTPPSKKKGKGSVHESKSESDHVDAGAFTAGDGLGFSTQVVETDVGVKMIEEELEDRQLSIDDDLPLTQLSSFRAQETDEGDALEVQEQGRHSKPRAASSLPIVFGEKVNRTKVLLECEGDALDLSGDMGAVGRFTVNRPDDELLLDLKGVVYKTTIVPSNTYFVVNVGQMEAKVESIMTDFVQLRADTSWNENETMVEGTLKDFAFESDEEGERPAVDGDDMPCVAEEVKHEEGAADDKQAKKKKPSVKTSGKVPVRKAAAVKSKVGKGKTSAKGGVGRKPTVKKAVKASIGKK